MYVRGTVENKARQAHTHTNILHTLQCTDTLPTALHRTTAYLEYALGHVVVHVHCTVQREDYIRPEQPPRDPVDVTLLRKVVHLRETPADVPVLRSVCVLRYVHVHEYT